MFIKNNFYVNNIAISSKKKKSKNLKLQKFMKLSPTIFDSGSVNQMRYGRQFEDWLIGQGYYIYLEYKNYDIFHVNY